MPHAADISVRRYDPDARQQWDQFVDNAKNGHFMFKRGYMDYHADRFSDHSLLFEYKGKLIALLPANESNGELVSHGGLTFGGMVSDRRMSAGRMLNVFSVLERYALRSGISRIVYKLIPRIYCSLPAGEDEYALFRHGARLFRRDLSTAISMDSDVAYASMRKRNLKKARGAGVQVNESVELSEFWKLLNSVLRERHGVDAVHTLEEVKLLRSRFPDAIRLCEARSSQGELLAGSLLYINRGVVHTQYLANAPAGREVGALDAVIDHAIGLARGGRYFDFGISTVDGGKQLNEGLQAFKEGFGARGVPHDFYEWVLS
jgi:hypothetical protein